MLTLFIGGTRSGKSQMAEHLSSSYGPNVLYIATAENISGAGSMNDRIETHRARRPDTWETLECTTDIGLRLQNIDLNEYDAIMLDCITLLVSNLLYQSGNALDSVSFLARLDRELSSLGNIIVNSATPWIIVSSETGLGIVPADEESRIYIDGLGLANQFLGDLSDTAYLCVAGKRLRLQE